MAWVAAAAALLLAACGGGQGEPAAPTGEPSPMPTSGPAATPTPQPPAAPVQGWRSLLQHLEEAASLAEEGDLEGARTRVRGGMAAYAVSLQGGVLALEPGLHLLVVAAFREAERAAMAGDGPALAMARLELDSLLVRASLAGAEDALAAGDVGRLASWAGSLAGRFYWESEPHPVVGLVQEVRRRPELLPSRAAEVRHGLAAMMASQVLLAAEGADASLRGEEPGALERALEAALLYLASREQLLALTGGSGPEGGDAAAERLRAAAQEGDPARARAALQSLLSSLQPLASALASGG